MAEKRSKQFKQIEQQAAQPGKRPKPALGKKGDCGCAMKCGGKVKKGGGK